MKPSEKKVPEQIHEGIQETKKLEELISILCTKLNDPTFDLKQLQDSLGEIRSTLDEQKPRQKPDMPAPAKKLE